MSVRPSRPLAASSTCTRRARGRHKLEDRRRSGRLLSCFCNSSSRRHTRSWRNHKPPGIHHRRCIRTRGNLQGSGHNRQRCIGCRSSKTDRCNCRRNAGRRNRLRRPGSRRCCCTLTAAHIHRPQDRRATPARAENRAGTRDNWSHLPHQASCRRRICSRRRMQSSRRIRLGRRLQRCPRIRPEQRSTSRTPASSRADRGPGALQPPPVCSKMRNCGEPSQLRGQRVRETARRDAQAAKQ